MSDADVIVVGAGLSGLVTATELTARGKRVLLLEAETAKNLGGQAWWSFGGLLLVDTPEQRRLGVNDSAELALRDWTRAANFAPGAEDGTGPDAQGHAWARRYVAFAAGPMREWLRAKGVRWFPLVQWAERAYSSVPRFHVTWGTGPGLLEPFVRAARQARRDGLLDVRFGHQVTELVATDGEVAGVRALVLPADPGPRGVGRTRWQPVGEVQLRADHVVIAGGGIGADHEMVRELWPPAAGRLPEEMLSGVPGSTSGALLGISATAGAALVHRERMWHYPEGVAMPGPVWHRHGIRILPGPSSLWLDADGGRFPAPLFPGFDALGALRHITGRGDDYSWFVANRAIMETEFALSGSDQNPDLTDKDVRELVRRVLPRSVSPVARLASHSPDFLWADSPAELAARMNDLVGVDRIDARALTELITERDSQAATGLGHDPQLAAISHARQYPVDRRIRVHPPRPLRTPQDGPLLAVRLRVLTRKTLGGLHTNGSGQVLRPDGSVLPGLWAVGESAGFGGGGVHGERSLEGTFLGGCLFTGRVVGRTI